MIRNVNLRKSNENDIKRPQIFLTDKKAGYKWMGCEKIITEIFMLI